MIKRMEVVKSTEIKRDPSGFILVTLQCPQCRLTKYVRRCDVKKRNRCAECERLDRAVSGTAGARRKRVNKNISPGGSVVGGLNRYETVFLYLEADSRMQCRIILSNKADRRPKVNRANWRWDFHNGDVPLMVLDAVGREPSGDPFAVLTELNALITLLKGE